MSLSSIGRQLLFVIALVLLLGLGWIGASGGFEQVTEARTAGQIIQTLAQFAFSFLAVPAALTVYWARPFGQAVLRCWEGSVAVAGGMAPVVWGDTSVIIGIVAGGAAFLVARGIVSLLRVGARGLVAA